MKYVTTCKHQLHPTFIRTLFYVFHLFFDAKLLVFLIENMFDILFLFLFIVSARD